MLATGRLGPYGLCMRRDYLKGYSRHLGRDMESLWYGASGQPVLMFPTSLGRFHQMEDFRLIDGIGGLIASGRVQVICIDSVDGESWYNKSALPAVRRARQEQYDAYVHEEVLPSIRQRAGRGDVVVFGCSFGAYHAANTAGRHPDAISKAILFSGLYGVQRFLDGYWDDGCYFHCPNACIYHMDEAWCRRLAKVSWVVATGEHDSLVGDNREFAALLVRKGIPVHTEIWPGVFGHDWPWWIQNLPRFL